MRFDDILEIGVPSVDWRNDGTESCDVQAWVKSLTELKAAQAHWTLLILLKSVTEQVMEGIAVTILKPVV